MLDTSVDIQKILAIAAIAGLGFLLSSRKYASRVTKGLQSLKIGKGSGTPILNSYTVDFTALATTQRIDPVIGRDQEIIRLAQILSRKGKNNAILVGAPGVGKTAIVEGLASRIISGEVPEVLKGKRLLSLNVASLLSGTKYRGEFEERAKRLVDEIAKSNRSIILFIDEIHSVIQSQGTEGSVNLSDILKPALARGDLQMIGATTLAEYNTYIKSEPSLERRFQPVQVKQPSSKETMTILQGVKTLYESHHMVTFTDAALTKKIKMRSLPDKAIDAIDEAGALVRVSHVHEAIPLVLFGAAVQKNPALTKTWKSIQTLDAKLLQNPSSALRKKREALEKKLSEAGLLVVDVDDIKHVINAWTHDF